MSHASPFRVSWSSVFAGCVIALVTYLVLSVLGTAIGASAIDPMQQGNPLKGFGTGAGVWLFISTLIAVIAGAWVAGRTAPDRGGLHGVLSWTITTLLTTWLLASLAGSLAGTAGNIAGKGLSLAADGVAAAAPGVGQSIKQQLDKNGISLDWDSLKAQLDTTLKQTGKPELDPSKLDQKTDQAGGDGKQAATQAATDPTQAGDQLKQWFDRIQKAGEPALNAADKEALVNIVAARTGKSHAEAQQIVDNYAQAYQQAAAKVAELKQQAEQQAREAADAAAKSLSKAAWGTLLMLLIGGAVSFGVGRVAMNSRPRVVVAEV
jgi:tape measure domain-containing protein